MRIKIKIKWKEYELNSEWKRVPTDDIEIEISDDNNQNGYIDGSAIKVSTDDDIWSNDKHLHISA